MNKYQIIIDGAKIVDPRPDVVARIFAEMHSDDQAVFFNTLSDIEDEWRKAGGAGWPMQLQHVTDSDELESKGRGIMDMIGDYGYSLSGLIK